jgi:hypothetical protein
MTSLKATHEKWVRDTLGIDAKAQYDDEIYADYIDSWATSVKLSNWTAWTSSLLSHGQPALSGEMKEGLDSIRTWILSRVWPRRYEKLEAAFTNFRLVAQDLASVFDEHAEKSVRADSWRTVKFYQIDEWNPELHRKLSRDYEAHVGLIEDLTLELTRAASYICDMVRESLMRGYRIKEGVLLVQAGPYSDFSWRTYRVEYRGPERTLTPYPGLKGFRDARYSRDMWLSEKPAV